MPEMSSVCQETTSTPPSMFGSRGGQGLGPPHAYYNHCGGYQPNSAHGQYSHDGYSPYAAPQPEQSPHHQHHLHHQQQHQQQQSWGYSMGIVGNSRPGHGVVNDEWQQNYLLASSTPTQGHYNYNYRTPNSHLPLDYASPLSAGPDTNPQVLDGSPSPEAPSPGEPPVTGMGPNNQGAKSLRPPYEWMKPSASLPQSGKTRTKDKYRVVYTDHQRLELEKEFHFSKYITIRRKAEIASQLGLSERQVKIWFQNRRAKERKQNKKRQEQTDLQGHSNPGSAHHLEPHHMEPHHQLLHDGHPFPKAEKEDDFSIKHELPCHSSALTSLTPPGPLLHAGLHNPPVMPPGVGRSSHASLARYHEGMRSSPASTAEDIAYRMTNGTDSAGNSMNLSGSSDSGVLSSH
ncbi:homeobox protein CDX-1-like isoform X2 [Physella acuta]|uniref:homeobox protein CDX-1-like isoform X2 n=1 Tax=Physella acuta TaxID=109671 RepID=UPI0027DD92F2|nr:homeobox protein CDX-1-like isoform X2 [Physella acuta]